RARRTSAPPHRPPKRRLSRLAAQLRHRRRRSLARPRVVERNRNRRRASIAARHRGEERLRSAYLRLLVRCRCAVENRRRSDGPGAACAASLAMPPKRPPDSLGRPLTPGGDKVEVETGCGAAWLARLSGGQEVPGSNPGTPTREEAGILAILVVTPANLRRSPGPFLVHSVGAALERPAKGKQ